MKRNVKLSKKTTNQVGKSKFERYLERVENNNQEVNYDLPENPTPLQVAKFDICQNILAYQQDNITLLELNVSNLIPYKRF